jgi:hypothetical protein
MRAIWLFCLVHALALSMQGATITGLSANQTTAETLVGTIVGPGITVIPGSVSLVGVNGQQGTFTNGLASIGLASGIVLTSGSAAGLNGANVSDPETLGDGGSGSNTWSNDLDTPGDSELTNIAGELTFDANVLSFSFQFGDGSVGGNLFFRFVFASEEYIDYVDSDFNDVFAFFVDGMNVALVAGQPITINNINPTMNAGSYVNNVANTNGFANAGRAIQADGFTVVLVAQALNLGPGTHRMSFRIADASDGVLDAAVFIGGGTFSNENPTVPEPGTWVMIGAGLALLGLGRRRRA